MARSHGVPVPGYTLKIWAKNRTHGAVMVFELYTLEGATVGRLEVHRVSESDTELLALARSAYDARDLESCYALAMRILEDAH